jgi:hypothetical protein
MHLSAADEPNNAGCSEKVATDCLKSNGWSVEGAIEYFFSSGLAATVGGIDPRAVESLYHKYRGDFRQPHATRKP